MAPLAKAHDRCGSLGGATLRVVCDPGPPCLPALHRARRPRVAVEPELTAGDALDRPLSAHAVQQIRTVELVIERHERRLAELDEARHRRRTIAMQRVRVVVECCDLILD